jgi:tetratricopeptide (TPR) repeat protein
LEDEIVKLDAENAAGLKSKYEPTVAYRQIDAAIQSEVYPLIDRGNYKAALARIDRLIAHTKPPRPQLQLLIAFKGQLHYSLGEKKLAAQFLDEAIALDPQSESAQRARSARLQIDGGR